MIKSKAKQMDVNDLRHRFEVPETTWHVYRTPGGRLTVLDRPVRQKGMVLLGRSRTGSWSAVLTAAKQRFGATKVSA